MPSGEASISTVWPLTRRQVSNGPSQLGHVRQSALRDPQPDFRRQAGDAAQLVERAVGDLDPAVHDDHAPGPLLQLGQRVRGQEHGGAASAQLLDDVVEGLAQRRVEAGGRLVEEQHPGLAEQRLGEAEPLAHAFRVGADPAVGRVREADPVEQRRDG